MKMKLKWKNIGNENGQLQKGQFFFLKKQTEGSIGRNVVKTAQFWQERSTKAHIRKPSNPPYPYKIPYPRTRPPSLCNSLSHFSLEEDQPKKMAVKIRLARLGCKNRAFYRIVVADSHTPRDCKHLQVVGGSLFFFFLPFSYYFHMLSSHEDNFFLILKTWTLKSYWVYFQVLK